mmetsp:Transcript_13808/g.20802  ORF Transcript_13808/g.20802 Transcript_13808/m.20802 type:complete len:252 (+) Transcript_13808:852-1607(+)
MFAIHCVRTLFFFIIVALFFEYGLQCFAIEFMCIAVHFIDVGNVWRVSQQSEIAINCATHMIQNLCLQRIHFKFIIAKHYGVVAVAVVVVVVVVFEVVGKFLIDFVQRTQFIRRRLSSIRQRALQMQVNVLQFETIRVGTQIRDFLHILLGHGKILLLQHGLNTRVHCIFLTISDHFFQVTHVWHSRKLPTKHLSIKRNIVPYQHVISVSRKTRLPKTQHIFSVIIVHIVVDIIIHHLHKFASFDQNLQRR